jgi:hypothetical protein
MTGRRNLVLALAVFFEYCGCPGPFPASGGGQGARQAGVAADAGPEAEVARDGGADTRRDREPPPHPYLGP